MQFAGYAADAQFALRELGREHPEQLTSKCSADNAGHRSPEAVREMNGYVSLSKSRMGDCHQLAATEPDWLHCAPPCLALRQSLMQLPVSASLAESFPSDSSSQPRSWIASGSRP